MLMREHSQSGFSMIEVLVAIVIVIIGLLGLIGLHARAGMVEMESFQRAQATELLQDMVDRISANRKNSMSYVTASPLGTGTTAGDCTGLTGSALDLCEWNNALLGAAESNGGGMSIGAMIGARGCVENVSPVMPRQFLVSVVWQGTVATKEPGTDCGAGLYGANGMRRAVTATVVIGCLQNDPLTGACVTP